jgi:Arc/MetJ family transcription regulator
MSMTRISFSFSWAVSSDPRPAVSEAIHQAMAVFYTNPPVPSCRGDDAMGRTNIVLDDRLIREGLRRFKCRSKRDLVHLALTELLKSARRRDVLSLRGQVKWDGDLAELRRLRP